MYAVIALQWHQYIVAQWSHIVVDQLDLKEWDTLTPDVLAVFTEDGARADFGTPTLSAKVTCKVISHQRGDKIRVLKFKRKNRYQRTIWFRPHQTVLQIKSVEVNG